MDLIALFVFGLLVGSFLNVLADRLPKGQDVLWGRSHCDHCKRTLEWFELIPIVSFVVQKGRCRRCRRKLSIQYPIVELTTAFGFVSFFFLFDYSLIRLFAYSIIFSSFLVIFVADSKYQIIPDSMVIAAAIGSILWIFSTFGLYQVALNALVGFLCMGFFWVTWVITRGRGMGIGDIKLAGALGIMLGFPLVLFALYIAFLTGAGVGVILILAGQKTLKSRIAFGPFLVLGTALAFVLETVFLNIWINLF